MSTKAWITEASWLGWKLRSLGPVASVQAASHAAEGLCPLSLVAEPTPEMTSVRVEVHMDPSGRYSLHGAPACMDKRLLPMLPKLLMLPLLLMCSRCWWWEEEAVGGGGACLEPLLPAVHVAWC